MATNIQLPDNLLPNLEVLHLSCNGIRELVPLQLDRMTSLKALFLQGNCITRLECLDGLRRLSQLVVDKNKVNEIRESCFHVDNQVVELHLEENRLKKVGPLGTLKRARRLYLGSNKIQDMTELYVLSEMRCLEEISLIHNPVTKRNVHRPVLIVTLPSLKIIDLQPVTEEEAFTANAAYAEPVTNPALPSVTTTAPVISAASNAAGAGGINDANSAGFTNILLVPAPAPTWTDNATHHQQRPAASGREMDRQMSRRRMMNEELCVQPTKFSFTNPNAIITTPPSAASQNKIHKKFAKYSRR